MEEKIKLTPDVQKVINVERLLSCICMLDANMNRIREEWYPLELRDAINQFHFQSMDEIILALIKWLENNTVEIAP